MASGPPPYGRWDPANCRRAPATVVKPFGRRQCRWGQSVIGHAWRVIRWSPAKTLSDTGVDSNLGDMSASQDGRRITVSFLALKNYKHVLQTSSSANGGVDWGRAVSVSDETANASGPALASSTDGTKVALVWMRSTPALHPVTSVSKDAGAHWTQPSDLSDSIASAPHVASSANGRRLTTLWWELTTGSSVKPVTRSSTDGGATWGPKTDAAPATSNPMQSQLLASSDGTKLVHVWKANGALKAARGLLPTPSFAADPLDFGSQTVGTTAERTLTVHNTGTAPLTVDDVRVEGGQFSLASNSCVTVAPSGSCGVVVRYTPTAQGAATGSVVFTDSTLAETNSVALSGSGTAIPAVSLKVKATGGHKIPAGKRTVLVSKVTTDGKASVKTSCKVKGKKAAKKVCKFKVKGTKVSAKPKCKKGLQIGVTVKGTATDRTPATWTKTWKLKKCKV